MEQNVAPLSHARTVTSSFIPRVYMWMTSALLTTAAISFLVTSSPVLTQFFLSNTLFYILLIFAELGLVIFLSARLMSLSPATATLTFFAYAALNGITLSVIVLAYTSASLASTFLVTAITFGVMSLYGYTTHHDLTGIGRIAIMALIGLIITSIVNMFFANSALYWIISYVGVLIFVALIAYDTQKLKKLEAAAGSDADTGKRLSIYGALQLYLDFINLFLMMLRFMGRRK